MHVFFTQCSHDFFSDLKLEMNMNIEVIRGMLCRMQTSMLAASG